MDTLCLYHPSYETINFSFISEVNAFNVISTSSDPWL